MKTGLRGFQKLTWLVILGLAAACSSPRPILPNHSDAIAQPGAPTLTPFQPVAPTPQPQTPQPTPTPVPPSATPTLPATPTPEGQTAIWIDPRLPAGLRSALAQPAGLTILEQPVESAARLELGGQQPVSRWVYAVAAPFSSMAERVSVQELQQAWQGQGAGPFADRPLLMDENTQAVFSALWGAPAPGAVEVLPAAELLDRAWKRQPAWAIIPFEALEPRWKVIEVDGQSPLRKDFDLAAYPLSVPVSVNGAALSRGDALSWIPATNRDPEKLTTVAMTGVTALVRATAFTMEQQGIQYPGKDVEDWLSRADITHISNEVPFAKNCPFPNPVQPDVRFCSDPRYIALLEDMGTDIVELTGDHFQDWGAEAMLYTLELYKERDWLYYGGGADLDEGRQAVTVEHNGNRLAFIGCNGKGGSFAQAGPNRPGAVTCDFDWMEKEISRLREAGYLSIVTFQHFEYYTYQAQPNQEQDFRRVAEAGAVIVSGSQAHQPQAMEFRKGAFIHYGLGNLFFDQYDISFACRQAFIDRHVFYGGRYIGTELLPILFIDYARPRPMTPGEREELLEAVFEASGW